LRRRAILVCAALVGISVGAAASAPALRLSQWAGRYVHSFMNGSVDGSRYRTLDQVEIRPVDSGSADVTLSLAFFNGHSCWLHGRARVEGSRLVLTDPEMVGRYGGTCRLELWRDRISLRWSDGENTCSSACGARGSFSAGSIPLRSKRRLPRVPLSEEDGH
jgi:hypothetical protein